MGSVVAFVSPQSGAAKPTAVMMLAEALTSQKRKSVLVIDSDPQTHTSLRLISARRWAEAESHEHTFLHFLQQALAYRRLPDIDSFLILGASNVAGTEALALMAGHPSLALFEWQTAGDEDTVRQLRQVLRHFVTIVRDQFDIVLVDCPASLTALTEAWLSTADGFITPVRPDLLAARNIAVLRTVEREAALSRVSFPEDLGVLIALREEDLTSHILGQRRIRDDLANRCFPLAMPRHAALQQAVDCSDERLAFARKYPGELADIAVLTAGTLLARLP